MNDQLTCTRCGSPDMIPDAELRDYDSSSYRPLTVLVPRGKPGKASFLGMAVTRDAASGTLRARVCGRCGAAELFCPEAPALWEAVGEGNSHE
jgi:hypothetical protein